MRIEQSYLIQASPERVWAALTDPARISLWTEQPAEYDARVGGKYRMFTDYVSGEVVEYDPPHRLAQTWQPNDWTIEDSVVTFTLRKARGGTRLDLVHENVQPEDYEGTRNGWHEFYVGAIKKMLEAEEVRGTGDGRQRTKEEMRKTKGGESEVSNVRRRKSATKKPTTKTKTTRAKKGRR